MDPLSIIASSIGVVTALIQTYAALQTVVGLPEAFRRVEQQLPIVESALRQAKKRLRSVDSDPTDEEEAALCAILQPCDGRIKKLRDIVESLKKRRDSDKEKTPSWQRLRSAYHSLLEGKKANRVEDLMRAVLENMKTLALHTVFQTASKADLEKVEAALVELAKVAPSMDDDEIEANKGTIQATMNVADGGQGQQNNVQGDNNTFNSGENVVTGEKHTIYFGAVTIINNGQELQNADHQPRYSILPSWDAAFFVGRGDLLEELQETFNKGFHEVSKSSISENLRTPTVAVLTGIGGQGKSQTALRFCRQARGYEAVFWVNATTCETTRRSFEVIAADMSADRNENTDGLEGQRIVTWDTVTKTLASWQQKKWLLVFDNHDDPEHFSHGGSGQFLKLTDFFPANNNGSIIVTTRDARVSRGRSWHEVKVGAMSEDDGLKLLCQHIPNGTLSSEGDEAGRKIVRMLGGLPLAVAQTAWFIQKHALELQMYLEQFSKFKAPALRSSLSTSVSESDHVRNCFNTYEQSLAGLPDETRDAATGLLTLAATFADAAIYESFFEHYLRGASSFGPFSPLDCPTWLKLFAPGDDRNMFYSTCVANLADLNLVQRQRDKAHGLRFSLHPVIREWQLERAGGASSATITTMTRTAVAMLAAFLRTGNIYTMSLSMRQDVLAHINKFSNEQAATLNEEEEAVTLVFARFCRDFSRFKLSFRLLENLLEARRHSGQLDGTPGFLAILVELGHTYTDYAKYSVGASYYERALKTQARVAEGSPHLDVLRSEAKAGLANCLLAQNKRGARRLAEEVLQEVQCRMDTIKEMASSDVVAWRRVAIRTQLILSNILGQRGLLDAADRMAHKANMEANRVLGPADNLTLEAELNLHHDAAARGEPEKAIGIIHNVLRRIESYNGNDHRWAISAHMALGLIYGRQASHARARRSFELCRQRAHALFGDSPGDVSIDLLIGHTYAAENRWDQAEAIFKKCDIQTENAPGYEVVRAQVTRTMLRMYLGRGQYLSALPHAANVLLSFPFLLFFRANRVQMLVIVAALVLFVDALVRRQLMTLLLVGIATVAGLWLL